MEARVMLNLLNNAFYAVNQKLKTAGADYKPEVTVTTTLQPPEGGAKAILIIVKDNGIGIPDAIKDKIMQPLSNQRMRRLTGLRACSLTYDMAGEGRVGQYYYQQHDQPEKSDKYFEDYFKVNDAMEQGRHEFKVAQYEIDQNDKAQREHIDQLKQEKAVQDYQLAQHAAGGVAGGAAINIGFTDFYFPAAAGEQKTLASLRRTQTQLIQSEKMASLGELTAGIAHEIQNPLNFVNNFSEVNTELVDEMEQAEIAQRDRATVEIETAKRHCSRY